MLKTNSGAATLRHIHNSRTCRDNPKMNLSFSYSLSYFWIRVGKISNWDFGLSCERSILQFFRNYNRLWAPHLYPQRGYDAYILLAVKAYTRGIHRCPEYLPYHHLWQDRPRYHCYRQNSYQTQVLCYGDDSDGLGHQECFALILSQDNTWFGPPQNSPVRPTCIAIKDGDDARTLIATVPRQTFVVVSMVGVGLIWALVQGWQLTLV